MYVYYLKYNIINIFILIFAFCVNRKWLEYDNVCTNSNFELGDKQI